MDDVLGALLVGAAAMGLGWPTGLFAFWPGVGLGATSGALLAAVVVGAVADVEAGVGAGANTGAGASCWLTFGVTN